MVESPDWQRRGSLRSGRRKPDRRQHPVFPVRFDQDHGAAGRALEAKGDYKAAVEAYTALNDRTPEDTWAKLAKTRILTLQVEGKAE